MPLSDHFPVIDDRRFADLVEEARTRIPRYTPEWTDHNASDPGMALVDLFAWMTELLMYRLGKVPRLNYLKFLELVGLELMPAQPAAAEVTFPVLDAHTAPYVIVPRLAQVATDLPDALGPVVFETERTLYALTARLDTVQVHDGYGFRDVSAGNAGAQAGFDPFGGRAAEGSALYLGFDSPPALEFPSVEIDLAAWVKARPGGGVRACGAVPAISDATLAWEHWTGKAWAPVEVLADETGAFTRSGHVRLEGPRPGRMVRRALGKTAAPRFWLRARIVKSAYQTPPTLLTVRTNTVAATQAQTVEFEMLGGSNGRPDQTATLTGRPVLERSLVLDVDEGEGFRPWTEVPDFFGSGREDAHFVLNRASGEVRFGDGRRGRIPVPNVNRRANVRARRYRFGGGLRGTVGAGRINALLSGLAGIDAAAVANLFASGGGADEEPLQQAIDRAAATLKSRSRAVTPEDFEVLAVQVAGVGRAKALPLHHPEFAGVDVPGVVSVVIVPEAADPPETGPLPTEATLRRVCACLDTYRLLTTEVYVIPPRYRRIAVKTELVVEDDAELAATKRRVLASLQAYFDPLTGGEASGPDHAGPGWPFGGGVYYSLVTRRVLVEGVRRVASLEIAIDGVTCAACTDVPLERDMLLAGGPHEVSVRYEGGQ